MKVFVIFLVLLSIATLIPHTFGSGHNQDMGFFYLPLTTESKNHHILAQSTSANFVNAFYDSSLNSLLASISSVNSEDIISITMTNQTYWELFTGNGEKYVGGIQVLIDGDVRPYKKIQDDDLVTYLFKTPPNSGQIEIRPSTLRIGVDNVPDLEKLLDTLPLTYPPLKQEHIGTPINEIHCNDGLTLFHKYDNSPVCVKPETVPKLIERGWTAKDSSAQKTIDEITTPKYGTAEFDTEYHKARQIYLDVRKPMDLPFIGLTIDSTEKHVVLGINSDKLTAEKDKTYYRQLVDELFKDVNLNIMIHYKNTTGLIFDE